MKIFEAVTLGFLLVVLACLRPASGSGAAGNDDEQGQHPLDQVPGFYRTCDDLQAGLGSVRLSPGVSIFLAPIDCATLTEVHIKEQVTIRSHEPLQTKGVQFVIHRFGKLVLSAPAVHMTRAKNTPVFIVEGQLEFEVSDWIPSHVNAAVDDEFGIIDLRANGKFESKQDLRFTSRSIIAADLSADKVKRRESEALALSPALKAELASMHNTLTDNDDPDGASMIPTPAAVPATRLKGGYPTAPTTTTPTTTATTAAAPTHGSVVASDVDHHPNRATTTALTNTVASGSNAPRRDQLSRFQQHRTFENGVLQNCDTLPDDPTFAGGELSTLRDISCSEPTVHTQDLIWVEDGGQVESNAPVHCTAFSVMAADPAMAHQVDPDEAGSMVPDDPFLRQHLAKRHSTKGNIDSDFAQHPPEESADSDRSEFALLAAAAATATTSATLESYESRHPHSTPLPGVRPMTILDIISGTLPTDITGSDADTDNGRRSYDGESPVAAAPWGADSKISFADSTAHRGGVPSHDVAGGAANQNDDSHHSHDGGGSVHDGVPLHDIAGGTANQNDDSHHSHSGGGGGNNGNSSPSNQPSPPPQKVHASQCLKVGDILTGSLLSPGRSSLVHNNVEDGSLVFSRVEGVAPRDASGRKTSTPPLSASILIPADPRKVAGVKKIRFDIFQEKRKSEKAEQEGAGERGGVKKGKMATVLGWLPFGKAGWRQRRARERAHEHFGEVSMRITDRGVLEASLDGTVVLKKGGPSFFGYRRRSPSYEVWVTDKGIDVKRGGTVQWSAEVTEVVDSDPSAACRRSFLSPACA